ncbi:helix-turn-helix domain-containing protein [Aestuariibius sp. 2305UL40-4]|uniref:helix-turn-helix domain-containing protein n=1 Tax=Aestuariibius violaceus TaxID=3234132 RepID=UPI00345ECE59
MKHTRPQALNPASEASPTSVQLDAISQGIGERLQTLRKLKGWSRGDLGAALGISSQQIRKYETAENKISAEKLGLCATALGVPVGSFYGEGAHASATSTTALTIAKTVDTIPDYGVKKALYELAKAINELG